MTKPRNPIARVVTKIPKQIIPDKKKYNRKREFKPKPQEKDDDNI